MPKCSKSIFMPISIKIMPPASSALDLNLEPKTLPIFTPIAESVNVITPMNAIANQIFTSGIKPNVTPTASASMLVAIAMGIIALKQKESQRLPLIANPEKELAISNLLFAPFSRKRLSVMLQRV